MARTATKKKTTKKVTKATSKKSRVTKLSSELSLLLEGTEEVKKPRAKTAKKRTATTQATTTVQEVPTRERNFSPELFERHYIPFKSLIVEKEGQLTKAEMRKLSITARLELWKNLNKDEETRFVAIVIPEEARKERVSFAEAVARGLIEEKKPVKDALYCGYCQDWQKFKKFTYLDSEKCIGCGISKNDFYVKTDNGLWATKS